MTREKKYIAYRKTMRKVKKVYTSHKGEMPHTSLGMSKETRDKILGIIRRDWIPISNRTKNMENKRFLKEVYNGEISKKYKSG